MFLLLIFIIAHLFLFWYSSAVYFPVHRPYPHRLIRFRYSLPYWARSKQDTRDRASARVASFQAEGTRAVCFLHLGSLRRAGNKQQRACILTHSLFRRRIFQIHFGARAANASSTSFSSQQTTAMTFQSA